MDFVRVSTLSQCSNTSYLYASPVRYNSLQGLLRGHSAKRQTAFQDKWWYRQVAPKGTTLAGHTIERRTPGIANVVLSLTLYSWNVGGAGALGKIVERNALLAFAFPHHLLVEHRLERAVFMQLGPWGLTRFPKHVLQQGLKKRQSLGTLLSKCCAMVCEVLRGAIVEPRVLNQLPQNCMDSVDNRCP